MTDPTAAPAKRANVLFVISDQLRADHLGFEILYDLDGDPDELTNLAVARRDPVARIAAVDALVDETTRADDLTRPESVCATASTV